jgi:CheY-like chemotaxis protein
MKTILLVDDDQPLRAVLGLALRRSGYRVIEADSGAAGLEMARQHLPDLILSDIDMPGGDGASLLREIRRDAELKSRQVVLMTGTAELLSPRQGMEEGADASLLKPVSLHQLLNCVKARFSPDPPTRPTEDQWAA